MIQAISMDDSGNIIKEHINKITRQTIDEALKKHEYFYKQGVILSEYNDDIWRLTNQRTTTYIRFSNQKESMVGVCQECNWDYRWFIDSLKTYVLHRLGKCMIETMTTFVNFCISETVKSALYTINNPVRDTVDVAILKEYSEFIRLVSPNSTDYLDMCYKKINYFEYRDQQLNRKKHGPRVLNEFSSYFTLDKIFKEWRSDVKEQNELLYFYPLYLFWTVTTILPLRVNEFCSTPYNCLTITCSHYNLTIRRSRLKGRSGDFQKIHSYSIDGDFTEHTYEIPKWLFDEIKMYQTASEGYHRNHNLLFSLDFMVKHDSGTHKKEYSSSSVFNDESLGELWRDFYSNIVVAKYGYAIVSEKDLLTRYMLEDGSYKIEDNEIMMIQSCHTRHLAMINLVFRGCNPMIVKEFAGHTSESMSAHYYSNFANIARTAVMRLYYQSKRLPGEASVLFKRTMTPASTLIQKDTVHIEVDMGKCYSQAFLAGQIDDCSACGGECSNCRYFIPNKKDSFNTTKEENRINQEIAYISAMLRSPDIVQNIEEYQIRYQNLVKDTSNYATKVWKELEEQSDAEK